MYRDVQVEGEWLLAVSLPHCQIPEEKISPESLYNPHIEPTIQPALFIQCLRSLPCRPASRPMLSVDVAWLTPLLVQPSQTLGSGNP